MSEFDYRDTEAVRAEINTLRARVEELETDAENLTTYNETLADQVGMLGAELQNARCLCLNVIRGWLAESDVSWFDARMDVCEQIAAIADRIREMGNAPEAEETD